MIGMKLLQASGLNGLALSYICRKEKNKEERTKNDCSVKCHTCDRQFRRECDKASHKCIEEQRTNKREMLGVNSVTAGFEVKVGFSTSM